MLALEFGIAEHPSILSNLVDSLQSSSALLAAVLSLLTACAPVMSLDGQRLRLRSAAFAEYVESVFRRQNEIATELAFALDQADFDSAAYRQLEAAESELLSACAGLNELATRRRDGGRSGGLAAAGAARSAPDCERAAVAAEDALGNLGRTD